MSEYKITIKKVLIINTEDWIGGDEPQNDWPTFLENIGENIEGCDVEIEKQLGTAIIQLDTVIVPKSVTEKFYQYCIKHAILWKVIKLEGPSGWPIVEYQGYYKDLVEMIKEWWDDEDLIEMIKK